MKEILINDNNFAYNPINFNDLIIYQLGELQCGSQTTFYPHLHDGGWIEYSYVISGKAIMYANGIPTPVKKNDLYISHDQEIHFIESDKNDCLRMAFFSFNFSNDSPLKKSLEKCLSITKNEHNRVINIPNLNLHFFKLFAEIKGKSPIQKLIFENDAKLLISKTICKYLKEKELEYVPPSVSPTQYLYNEVICYIDYNYNTIKSIDDLAKKFGYSTCYLSRIFKKINGQNLKTYISNKRLNEAKKLFEKKGYTVSYVSNFFNYSSIYVFSRAFKKLFNISPKVYIKLYQQKK